MAMLMGLGVSTLASVYGYSMAKSHKKKADAQNSSFDEQLAKLNKK